MKGDYTKERYITAGPGVEHWEGHVNHAVLKDYAHLLHGALADFGCNHGACTILAARNPRVTSVVGVDCAWEALGVARSLLASCAEPDEVRAKVSYRVAMLDATGLERASLDGIVMFHTLEHIYEEDHEALRAEMRRLLKPDGVLIVTVPHGRAHNDPAHVAWFTLESLRNVFDGRGFLLVDCGIDGRDPCGECLNAVFRRTLDVPVP